MKKLLVYVTLITALRASAQEFPTVFEKSGGRATFTYPEGIAFCRSLDSLSPFAKLEVIGQSEANLPVYVLILNDREDFTRDSTDRVLLVNNAIHPGEPDGVEASLALARDYCLKKETRERYKGITILIIPFYNIGGALNRNAHTRVNQEGPEEYGFRGSATYLDLNRDFIKADATETLAFYRLFHRWKPQVFIDTHVSNGADYQYTMTLIHSQEEKYNASTAGYLKSSFIPLLYRHMANRQQEMIPYVNLFDQIPDSGYVAFMETPRYSNGYTSLFDCISLVAESHMLKPYPARVEAHADLLDQVLLEMQGKEFYQWTLQQRKKGVLPTEVTVQWKLNREKRDSLLFKGYAAEYPLSEVSGQPRLRYNRDKPWQKHISYWQSFDPAAKAAVPDFYVIPQQWHKVITRLEAQGVNMQMLPSDTRLKVKYYRINEVKSKTSPYEGHFYHDQVKLDTVYEVVHFRKGDWMVLPDERTALLLASVLEPASPDSYFRWNFFDAVLQQKEWFSDYVFEDLAAQYLKEHPEVAELLEKKKKEDPGFAADAFAQLYFVYRHSPYYEPMHRVVPVFLFEGN